MLHFVKILIGILDCLSKNYRRAILSHSLNNITENWRLIFLFEQKFLINERIFSYFIFPFKVSAGIRMKKNCMIFSYFLNSFEIIFSIKEEYCKNVELRELMTEKYLLKELFPLTSRPPLVGNRHSYFSHIQKFKRRF